VQTAKSEPKTFKCYDCGEVGHKRPDCPHKTKRTKVVIDTGADLTLLPIELDCVKKYTGESSVVRGVGNTPQLAPVAEVEFVVEGVKMEALAAMVPEEYIKWEGALAFSLKNDRHWEWLSKINK